MRAAGEAGHGDALVIFFAALEQNGEVDVIDDGGGDVHRRKRGLVLISILIPNYPQADGNVYDKHDEQEEDALQGR